MWGFKKHMSWLFLWIFLVPQINNTLHFWIIKHDFSRELTAKQLVSNKSNIHYCDQNLFKTPSMLLLGQDFDIPNFVVYTQQRDSVLVLLFKKIVFIGYYLRGPPCRLFS